MKKKLIFCISIILTAAMCITTIPFSAFSYDTNVSVSATALMLINTDTDTIVYEKNVDKISYLSYLSHIMTYIVVNNYVGDIDKETVEIKDTYLDKIPNSDKTLEKYVGKKLTVRDLLYFMMLENGTDAAYVLADYVSNGNFVNFVKMMNDKALSLGCTKTNFVSPCMSLRSAQHSTCNDFYKIVKAALSIESFREICGTFSYLPSVVKDEKHSLYNKNSLINPGSTYYFSYVTGGKFAMDRTSGTNIVATCCYKDTNYLCIAFGSKMTSERNAFIDAKYMFIWAYNKLQNKQILSGKSVLGTTKLNAIWGETDIELTTSEDIYRTMPIDFDTKNLEFKFDVPDGVKLPVFEGQNLGVAKIYYDGKLFDEVNLVSKHSEGIGMLDDMGKILTSMYEKTIPDKTADDLSDEKQPSTDADAQASTQTKSTDAAAKETTKATVGAGE